MPLGGRGAQYQKGFICCICALVIQICTAVILAPAPNSAATAISVNSGKVTASKAGCSNGQGVATVSLTVTGFPTKLEAAPATCYFLPWTDWEAFRADTLLVTGMMSNASLAMLKLHSLITAAPASPASLLTVENLDSTQNDLYLATCKTSGNAAGSAVIVSVLESQGFGVGLLHVALPEAKLRRLILTDAQPLLGPAGGGTDVFIQGEGLQAPVVCTFSNGSFSANVTARDINSTSAACTAPSWGGFAWRGDVFRDSVVRSSPVTLTVASGGCAIQKPFVYYPDPEVLGVLPLQGPRYGSFQLTVSVGAIIDFTTIDWAELLPTIRIAGGDLNGSDLTLPANWTSDGRGLVTETPIERSPLAAGLHKIHVSLNGQQYSNDLSVDTSMLTVEGPAVFMEHSYYQYAQGSSSIDLGVQLQGFNTLPVTANLSVQQRSLSGQTSPADSPTSLEYWLEPAWLAWEAMKPGLQMVRLKMSGNMTLLGSGGLLVSIDAAENADVQAENSSSILTALDSSHLVVGFALQPNQVAYRGDNASVPVDVANAALRVPASAQYDILTSTGSRPAYLVGNVTSGLLLWDEESGDEMELEVPIDWDLVDYDVEDHLMITLTPIWNARVPQQQRDIALHVFGVQAGQCPPGTFRFSSAPVSPPPASVQEGAAMGNRDHAVLTSLTVSDEGGWSFDLSSQFQPNISDYGVIVPAETENATLCTVPLEDDVIVALQNMAGNSLQPLSVHASTRVPPAPSMGVWPFEAVSFGGRRLRDDSVTIPAAGPADVRQSSVSALGTRDDGVDQCQGFAWDLQLAPGQNDFRISVMQNGQPVAKPPPSPAKGRKNGSSPTGSRVSTPSASAYIQDSIYALAIVRLADISHAEMAKLNVAEGNITYALCENGVDEDGIGDSLDAPPCTPDSVMQLNVSAETSVITLHPALRYPGLQNLRVEVAGQVLSQGGNIGADQLADTTAATTTRENSDFLPVAYIAGLQPGIPMTIPIVVVAEDDVTSLTYYVQVLREEDPEANTSDLFSGLLDGTPANGPSSLGSSAVLMTTNSRQTALPPPPPPQSHIQEGWPVPPSHEAWCHSCPAGWATTGVDESHCSMCIPGSFANFARSPACQLCPNGTYANSWGSSHCNHCIIGTFAPYQGSRLCYMCPENMTNVEDGSSSCSLPVKPGTNLTLRYAVIVSFGVYLNGTTLDEIAAKVGVNASSRLILERLVRSDTATAFNITSRDVNVTSISQVGRRVLLVNVSATLGVDLPTNSSDIDVEAELAVKNLSADEAIDLMAFHPDRFWVRTTKALDVTAEADSTPPTRKESIPTALARHPLLPWYGTLLLILGVLLLLAIAARIWRNRLRRVWLTLKNRWRHDRSQRLVEEEEQKEDAVKTGLQPILTAEGGKLTSRGRTAPSLKTIDKEPMPGLGSHMNSST